MWFPVGIAVLTLVVMEPLTYLAHRFVMHGVGSGWHRSHHRRRVGRLEANDLYPVVFASLTIGVMALGAFVDGLGVLLPIGAGITAYGFGYLFVHELYIHRRWGRFTARWSPLERLVDAHAIHHRFGGEPYGFLFPIVPRSLAERAASTPPRASGRDGRPTDRQLDRQQLLANDDR